MDFVRNVKNKNVVKKVEYASDYVATGEWVVATEQEYKEAQNVMPKKPQELS